ncbi:MAG: ATP-dependent DNA helicase RecG [Caulobacteraceae bacterium]|nr:MAG: ATP-dependent DNA helicase RecG [Caulobacteraceae bacterium]
MAEPSGLLVPAPLPRGYRRETAELMAHVAGGPLARDFAFLAPTGAIDRRNRVSIADTTEGEIATIEAEVDAHLPSFGKMPYRIRLRDETGFLSVTYFRARADMLKRMWPVGQKRLVSGKVQIHSGERQMLHPDHVVDPATGESPPNVEAVYPLTAGLSGRQVQRFVRESMRRLTDPPEWLDPATLAARNWPAFAPALRLLHEPQEPADIAPEGPARTRLAFDELFLRQVALHLRRATRKSTAGRAIPSTGGLGAKILASLPFAPTGAQVRADKEIAADIAQPSPMLRLLQGDVGSGKTLVAALAMARAAECGVQSALMAPTELLARQHGESIVPLLAAAGLEAVVLTGRDKGKDKAQILKRLATGEIAAVIGTHALFQQDVKFHDLGFVVIDEQHRFGVSDRMKLVAKGGEPHVLVMSATPIPRTLALAVHGDMDVSVLDEKPPGRKQIQTRALPTNRMDDVIDAISRASAQGDRAYWVCPLIEESELSDLAAVEDRYEDLRAHFGDAVAVVHGKMSATDRDRAMERFKSGEAFVLVATTVIEVGVNIPEATIMVIEHAERFGLAQLHQLRGRIGRGDKQGTCLLLWRPPLSENAKERLDALRKTDDGFVIAELDYKMRGSGDILGVRQSGFPDFRFVQPEAHGDLLPAADREARLAIQRDPKLETPRGKAIAGAAVLFGVDVGRGQTRSG